MPRYRGLFGEWIVGPAAGAAIGFVVTWCVIAFVIRFFAIDQVPDHVAVPVLIVSSTAIALLVAARARRNRTPL